MQLGRYWSTGFGVIPAAHPGQSALAGVAPGGERAADQDARVAPGTALRATELPGAGSTFVVNAGGLVW